MSWHSHSSPTHRIKRARIAGYATIFEQLCSDLTKQKIPDGDFKGTQPLARLQLSEHQFAEGMIAAWATVGEVLSFYQDRLIDEGYLSSAAPSESLWKVVELIGAYPAPQPSSVAHLSFTAAQSTGLNLPIVVPAGTTILGIDVPGSPPVVYETTGKKVVKSEHNSVASKPKLEPATLKASTPGFLSTQVQGVSLGLREGDRVLLLPSDSVDGKTPIQNPIPASWMIKLSSVSEEAKTHVTTLSWPGTMDDLGDLGVSPAVYPLAQSENLYGAKALQWNSLPVSIQVQQGGHLAGGVMILAPDGSEWTTNNEGLPIPPVGTPPTNGLVSTSSGMLVAATNQGVYVSEKPYAEWTLVNTGLTSFQVTALAVSSKDELLAGTAVGTVFLSSDGGKIWEPIDGIVTVEYTPGPDKKGVWTPVSTKLPVSAVRYLFWFEGGSKPCVVAATDKGVYSADPNTTSWKLDTWATAAPTSIDFWAGSSDGKTLICVSNNTIYTRSVEASWKKWGVTPNSESVLGLAVCELTESKPTQQAFTLYSLTKSGLYESSASGAEWTLVPREADDNNELQALSLCGGQIACISESGLDVWDPKSQKWTIRALKIPSTPTQNGGAPDGSLFCVTNSTGVVEKDWPTAVPIEGQLDLSGLAPEILIGDWILLEHSGPDEETTREVFWVDRTSEVRRNDMMLTGEVTRLSIPNASLDSLKTFNYRETSVFFASKPLPLAQVPTPVAPMGSSASQITLAVPMDGIEAGQKLILTGMPATSADGNSASSSTAEPIAEIAEVAKVTKDDNGNVTLEFKSKLKSAFDPTTVEAMINVVAATQGNTVSGEILGNGNGALAYQSFKLQQGPLAYLADQSPKAAQSTLQVSVEDIVWTEVDSLHACGPDDKVYMVRLDEKQFATIYFGNGKFGARLPSGIANIKATYRVSAPQRGQIQPANLKFWEGRPMGVEKVTNPVATQHFPPPISPTQSAISMARNLQVMDRAINLEDLEVLALSVAGVVGAKAQRLATSAGQFILISVATSSPTESNTTELIESFLRTRKGFPTRIVARACRVVQFDISIEAVVDAKFLSELSQSLPSLLNDRYTFPNWPIAKDISTSEIASFIQRQPGVLGVQRLELKHAGETIAFGKDLKVDKSIETESGLPKFGLPALSLTPNCVAQAREGLLYISSGK